MSFVQASVDPRRLRARLARSRRAGVALLAAAVALGLGAAAYAAHFTLAAGIGGAALVTAILGVVVLRTESIRLARQLGPAGERAVVRADESGITLPATGLVAWSRIELVYVMTTGAGTARAEDAVLVFVRDGEEYRSAVTTPRTASLVRVTARASGTTVGMVRTPPGSIFGEGQVLALQNTIAIFAQLHNVPVLRGDEGHALPSVVQRVAAG